MARKYLEISMTPSVKNVQERCYGRSGDVHSNTDRDPLGPDEIDFIADRDSFYMATVSETGWPYIQHRGGEPGFHVSLTLTRWLYRITRQSSVAEHGETSLRTTAFRCF
jgi:hypothetical protein